MTSNNYDYEGLHCTPTADAIAKAKQSIYDERSGEQHGLFCRWDALDRAMLKYWRFEHTSMIAGMSGSGKSYFLNMLRQDFLDTVDITYTNLEAFNLTGTYHNCIFDEINDSWKFDLEEWEVPNARYWNDSRLVQHDGKLIHKAINKGCIHDVVVLHLGFEMSAADELLRMAGNTLGKSYGFLMSSEWSEEIKDYAKLTDMELQSCEEVLDSFSKRKEYYVATSGNVRQIYSTVEKVANMHPNCKLIISIDHTLLSKRLTEKSDMDLQASMGLLAIDLREHFGAMVIYLNQLNQSIEHQDRVTKPAMHYPTKKDIHLGSQIWWAMDNVMINHRPVNLRIKEYGIHKLRTSKLIHGVMLKSRKGLTGNIWLKEDFAHGRILPATKDDFLPVSS